LRRIQRRELRVSEVHGRTARVRGPGFDPNLDVRIKPAYEATDSGLELVQVQNYFSPNALPAVKRRNASSRRRSFVACCLADSIQAKYRRRCSTGSALKCRYADGCVLSAASMYPGSFAGNESF